VWPFCAGRQNSHIGFVEIEEAGFEGPINTAIPRPFRLPAGELFRHAPCFFNFRLVSGDVATATAESEKPQRLTKEKRGLDLKNE
jgi:hypothetical protein